MTFKIIRCFSTLILIGLCALAVAAQTSPETSQATPSTNNDGNETYVLEAANHIYQMVLDRESIRIRDAFLFADKHGSQTFCVIFAAKNKMGGYGEPITSRTFQNKK